LMFGVKFGLAGGLAVLAIALVALALFGGHELAAIYGVFALMAGLILGLLGRVRVIENLIVIVAAVLLAATAGLSFYFYGSWQAMFADFRAALIEQFASAMRLQEQMGMPQESLQMFRERSPQIVETMLQLLPALLFLSFGFITLINILYLGRRFAEHRARWFILEHLREWKGPEPLVWGLIGCGFALFVPGLEAVRAVALNGLVVIGAFYFAQGLAVIAYFFHKNNVPRFLRGMTYLLIVFQQIFTLLVVGLGLFDLWGDFRRLRKDNLTPSQAC